MIQMQQIKPPKNLESSFAAHPRSKYWSARNAPLTPDMVCISSRMKCWFNCDCGHKFQATLGNINGGKWCPFCYNRKLCKKEEGCTACTSKSLASNGRAVTCWHPTRNGSLTPRDVFNSSHKKVWFICAECNHEFDAQPKNVTHLDNWCPFCSNKRMCGGNEGCEACISKSLASNERAASCWHPTRNGALTPRDVFKSSRNKLWFICAECNHEFDAHAYVTHLGCWCPYCANNKLCSNANCTMCDSRSLASLLTTCTVLWDKEANGPLEPRCVTKFSKTKAWFKCTTCGQTAHTLISNVAKGQGCGVCKHKTERKLLLHLQKVHPTFTQQFTATWCRNIKALPFDFALAIDKIIIELDGAQHFTQVHNWNSPEELHARDVFKQKCANDNGFRVIRVLQTDVWFDRNDWLAKVLAAIEELRNNGGAVANIYISSGNEYDVFTEP